MDGIPSTRLDNWQFQKVLCMESDWMSTHAQKPTLFRFYDYAPLAFQKIRSLSGIKEEEYSKSMGPEQIINSLWTNNMETLYELCSSGRSGALFYYTKDKKYLLKTVPEREFVKLRSVLREYLEHLVENHDSLITKFFGMYKLQWENPEKQTLRCGEQGPVGYQRNTSYLVVMDNLFKSFDVGIRFDMKGSSANRTRLKNGM